MTTTNANLFEVISQLDNAAKIPALRAITHSMMAKAIGAIRQAIRDAERGQRSDEYAQNDLDVRNSADENARAHGETDRLMGFEVRRNPMELASEYHAVYIWASHELKTIASSKWDLPLEPAAMLEFMASKAQPLDQMLAGALAKAAGCDVATIRKMHELQEQQEQEQLIAATPEILSTFEGFGECGYETSMDVLDVITQHQLGVKTVESLVKEKDKVLQRVMRSRRLSDLGSIPLIDEGVQVVSKWVDSYENKHSDEIRDALDSGRNVRTLDDI